MSHPALAAAFLTGRHVLGSLSFKHRMNWRSKKMRRPTGDVRPADRVQALRFLGVLRTGSA